MSIPQKADKWKVRIFANSSFLVMLVLSFLPFESTVTVPMPVTHL
jgi:hypothetical protein